LSNRYRTILSGGTSLVSRKAIRGYRRKDHATASVLLDFLLVAVLLKPFYLILLILDVFKLLVNFFEALSFLPNFNVFCSLTLKRQPTESDGLLVQPNALFLPYLFF